VLPSWFKDSDPNCTLNVCGGQPGALATVSDNLAILREHLTDESVDLLYLGPPFNSQATYNVLFRSPTGTQSPAQIEAFEDTWH